MSVSCKQDNTDLELLLEKERQNRARDGKFKVCGEEGCFSDDNVLEKIFGMIKSGFMSSELSSLLDEHINRCDSRGMSPLTFAIRYNEKVVDKILSNPKLDYSLPYVVATACKHGNNNLIWKILDYPFDINAEDHDGYSPLMLLCKRTTYSLSEYNPTGSLVKLLKKEGLKINATNKFGESMLVSLLSSSDKNNISIYVPKILEHPDIDLSLKDRYGKPIIQLIFETGNQTLIDCLFKKFGDNVVKNQMVDALIFAVKNFFDLPLLEKIMNLVDINYQDEMGNSAIFYALESSNKTILDLLLRNKELDLSIKNNYGETVVYNAIKYEKKEVFNSFIEYLKTHKKTDQIEKIFNSTDSLGQTAFLRSVKENDTDRAMMIYELTETDPNVRDLRGKTPLIYTIENRNKILFSLLLANPKIDINLPDHQKVTPLMYALAKLSIEKEELNEFMAFTLLKRSDINVNAQNLRGDSVLNMLIQIKYEIGPKEDKKTECSGFYSNDLAPYPECFGQSITGFQFNSTVPVDTEQHIDQLLSLIIKRDDIDVNLSNGKNTILHTVCEKRDLVIFNLLMNKKSTDLNCKNSDGKTPLVLLIDSLNMSHKKLTDRVLESNDKPVEFSQISDFRAFQLDVGFPKGLKKLASWDIREEPKESTKIKLIDTLGQKDEYSEQIYMIKQLVQDPRTDLNLGDYNNDTPLIRASKRSDIGTIDVLINKRTNLDLQNYDGKTALMFLVENQFWTGVITLLENGVDLSVKNKNGLTVYELAGTNKMILENLVTKHSVPTKKGWFGG